MRTKILALGLVFAFLFMPLLSQEKEVPLTKIQIYFKKALETDLTFMTSEEKAQEIWQRIQSFIAKYSSMKIQTSTDYVIETYNPTKVELDDAKWPRANYGYKVIKTIMGDKVEFEVKCFTGESDKWYQYCADVNAHILAYYALTGEIISECIYKIP